MRRRLSFFAVLSAVLVFIPAAIARADITILGGTIPCTTGWDCTLCAGVTVMQFIINAAIIIALPVAAVMFTWAGALLMVSAANPEGRKKAIGIFKTVGIGFFFVLCGWIIVDTLLRVVVINPNPGYLGSGKSWNSVGSCTDIKRPLDKSVSQLLYGVFAPGTPNVSSIDGVTCPSGSTPVGNGCAAGTGGSGYVPPVGYTCSVGEFDPSTGGCLYCDDMEEECSIIAMTSPSGISSGSIVTNPQMASQLSAACATYSVDCAIANGIAMQESSGGKNCTTSETGAAGCMQVLATTACDIQSSISPDCSACLSSKNSESPACKPVIQTISSNTQLGVDLGVKYISQLQSISSLQSLIATYGKCQIVAASYFQGAGTVISAGGVPSNAQNYVKAACG